MDIFNGFYKKKKILITGHTGFIGSWLSIWLKELGAEVIGYALPPYTQKDNFVVSKLEDKIVSVIGDIRDYNNLLEVFKIYQPEIIFHLAAQPIVRKSYFIPKETYDINVGGSVNILESFRNSSSSKILINFTTDKCYKNLELDSGYCEDDSLGGHDPYSSSKACSELVTSAYRQSFFNSKSSLYVSTIRAGNVVGGGDWQEDRLIPDCMRAIKENKSIIIRNPDFIRPWQYVLEPIRGILMLTHKMYEKGEIFSDAWNLGPDNNSVLTVREIVEKILSYIGKGHYVEQPVQDSNNFKETKTLLLNCEKAKKLLGWKPAFNIANTIKFLCDWYLEKKPNYDFNVKQIESYIKTII